MGIPRSIDMLRFVTSHNPTDRDYLVYDRDNEEVAAGPYETQAQAVFVAYFLNDNPTSVPFAPNPNDTVTLGELKRWHA